ncbi:MAG: hypothetical protein FWD17_02475 [Polyangiaceae bacterium]|nr:hypothetical protein [Polyangiaceae bacterium]
MDVARIGERLFRGTLAPLVLGGTVAPYPAIGARVGWSLGAAAVPVDRALADRVHAARVRRARALAPVDDLAEIDDVEWALGAAFHDLLQAANPIFDAPLRRYAAVRILDVARASIDRAKPPSRVGEALARHTWFARIFAVKRTDTSVSHWLGSRRYLGREPPAMWQTWPERRRVSVARERIDFVDLAPLAVDRERLTQALAALLERTPLTDIATCTRQVPKFAWSEPALALLQTDGGLRLALRALDRAPAAEVDAALGRATRDVLSGPLRGRAGPVVTLLAERAVASLENEARRDAATATADTDARFALGIGAVAAARALATAPASRLRQDERARLSSALVVLASRVASPLPEPPAPPSIQLK